MKQKTKRFAKKILNIIQWSWEKIIVAYHRVQLFLKNRVWLIAKRLFIIGCFLLFIAIIFFLTMRGLEHELSSRYENLFGILTQTIGTIVAIFFSLILIPLNQIATKYSPKFLRFLKKDLFFIFVFSFSVFSLVYDVLFLFIGASQQIAIVAIIMFVLLIVLLGLSVLHIIKISNPYNSILLPSHKGIVKTFSKLIARYLKACEKMAKKTFKGQEDLKKSVDICLFKIDDKITDYIQESLLPIREIAIKAIKDLDLEQAKNAIQTMMSVVVNYLYSRKDYHSDDDPLLYFLYTEYKLIAQAGSNELKIRLHPFIVDCWRRVGVQAAVINVKGMKRLNENFNFLVTYPVLGLKDLCALNLLEMDSYAPAKACDALADIGVQLMKEGYDRQAALIVQDLEKISIIAEQQGIKNVSGGANYAIMRIYTAGVSFRNFGSKGLHNFPYEEINKSIDALLKTFLQSKRTTSDNMILSPFIGWLVDPFKGLNFSKISEYGIFSPDLNKFSLERNLECVKANIKSIKMALTSLMSHKDGYFSEQALENLYCIVLNLLAYLNEPMAKDHIIFYKKHPLLDKELATHATEIIIEALSVFGDLVKARADRYIFKGDHIYILFSLYFIILYEYKLRPNLSLKNLFDKTHKLLRELLTEYKALPDSDSNDDLYKYYRLLIVVLKKNAFTDIASDFDVPKFEYQSRGVVASHVSQYPETMFGGQWIIKRPVFQVNAYYYNNVEGALKLDKLKFY